MSFPVHPGRWLSTYTHPPLFPAQFTAALKVAPLVSRIPTPLSPCKLPDGPAVCWGGRPAILSPQSTAMFPATGPVLGLCTASHSCCISWGCPLSPWGIGGVAARKDWAGQPWIALSRKSGTASETSFLPKLLCSVPGRPADACLLMVRRGMGKMVRSVSLFQHSPPA
jgi:hypothetical protein